MVSQLDHDTHSFSADTARLLHTMVHLLSREKEMFLRELVSNASDPLDRPHFEALTNADLLADDSQWRSGSEADPHRRTLTGSDNGVGMSRAEIIENLGRRTTQKLRAKLRAINAQTPPKTEEHQTPESKTNQQDREPDEICKTSIPGSNPDDRERSPGPATSASCSAARFSSARRCSARRYFRVVAVEHAPGLVPGELHRNPFRHTAPHIFRIAVRLKS
jgi:hypothetical protein